MLLLNWWMMVEMMVEMVNAVMERKFDGIVALI